MALADEVMFNFGPELAADGVRALGALVEVAAAVDMEGLGGGGRCDELRGPSETERGRGGDDDETTTTRRRRGHGGRGQGGRAAALGHSGGTRGRRTAEAEPQRARRRTDEALGERLWKVASQLLS